MTDSVSIHTDLADASTSSVPGNCGDEKTPDADADYDGAHPKTPDAGAYADEASADEAQEVELEDAALTEMPAVEAAVGAPGSVALVRAPVVAEPVDEDCPIYPPPMRRAGKGGRTQGFRRCPANIDARRFFGESWAQSVKKRQVPRHFYLVDSRGLILATCRNTCLDYNKACCSRHDCARYHTALGDLMNVLPRSPVRPMVMGKITVAQSSGPELFDRGLSLLVWPAEDLARIDARKKQDRQVLLDEMRQLEAQEAERADERVFYVKLERKRREADLARHAEAHSAIGAVGVPPQLLLDYVEPASDGASGRVLQPPGPSQDLQDEVDAADLRAELLTAKLAAVEARLRLKRSRDM